MSEKVGRNPLYRSLWTTRMVLLESGEADMVTRIRNSTGGEVLMTPAEVAALFRVSPKTVARWSRAGKLTALRTLGGHRRFRVDEVRALRAEVDLRFREEAHAV